MNSDFATPSSIPSIKRLAKAIQAEQGGKYSAALDVAAGRAGHSSFDIALRTARSQPALKYSVKIIDYWRDTDVMEAGTIELTVELSQPLTTIVKPHHLDGRLSAYKLFGNDTLESQITTGGHESTAKWFTARAARSLQFMEATGLKPCKKTRNIWPYNDFNKRIPDADHSVTWYHPELKKYVITDEPYHGHPQQEHPKRLNWCHDHGFDLEAVSWGGMHNPSAGTVLYLLSKTDDRVPLRHLANLANALPDPISNDEATTVSRRSIRRYF